MPQADLGATEQEVGEREHLLVLVPVQSCFAMLQRKAYDEYGHLGEKSFEDAHPNVPKGSLTHHGHLVVHFPPVWVELWVPVRPLLRPRDRAQHFPPPARARPPSDDE